MQECAAAPLSMHPGSLSVLGSGMAGPCDSEEGGGATLFLLACSSKELAAKYLECRLSQSKKS